MLELRYFFLKKNCEIDQLEGQKIDHAKNSTLNIRTIAVSQIKNLKLARNNVLAPHRHFPEKKNNNNSISPNQSLHINMKKNIPNLENHNFAKPPFLLKTPTSAKIASPSMLPHKILNKNQAIL